MDTRKFKTKTMLADRNNPRVAGKWLVALDVGYSAVKFFAPNAIGSFPSYAERVYISHGTVGKLSDEHIRYTDLDTGEVWIVGQVAQDNISIEDAAIAEGMLYQKERYNDPMFKVIARTGLGLALRKNQFGAPKGSEVVVQTGLPPKYLDEQSGSDVSFLSDVISGEHHFSLKIGSAPALEYHFQIPAENVFITAQPKGTLYSISANKENHLIRDAVSYFSKKLMIFDAGFGTVDLFPLQNHEIGNWQTLRNLGMKRVLEETAARIQQKYGQSIAVPSMQKYLDTGMFRMVNKKERTAKDVPFGEMLEAASKDVCMMALKQMEDIYPIMEYDYLVITGGTGAAWKPYVHEFYKNIDTLKIIDGNQNDDLPFVFANVRGYYLMRLSLLNSKEGK